MYKIDVYYIYHKHLSLSRLTNVLCSAWNFNQVSEFFIKRISCRWWKINVKAPGNLLSITEFHSINILFNQNSCLNETVKMAWVIFKVCIIYSIHSIFLKRWSKERSLSVESQLLPLWEGTNAVAVTNWNLWDLSKQRLKCDAHFPSDNSWNLTIQDQLKLL